MNNIKTVAPSSQTLVIRLGNYATDPIYWYAEVVGDENIKIGRICNYTELLDIPFILNHNVKILVSTSSVIFRKIEIIDKRILKNEQSLAFSIEKTIVSNIENFHIVILKSDSDFCHVVAVEHELMSRWLGWLANIGVSPTLLIPDVLALPFHDEICFPMRLDDEWLIRSGEVSGFSVNDAIFKSLCSCSSTSLSYPNRLSHFYSQTSHIHLTGYCDVLRIMANNIENSHANLLTGRYYRHRKKMISNASLVRSIYWFFLLSIMMCFNSWSYKNDILRDIHMLNVALQDFHTHYPLVQEYIDEKKIIISGGFYSSHDNIVKPDLISLLYGIVEKFSNLDIDINSIHFANVENEIHFNINILDRDGVGLVLNNMDKNDHKLKISKIINNDGTCDIIFKYNL